MDDRENISREELLARIKAAVLAVAPDAEVSLYGSRARGDAHEESDWDILVLISQNPTDEVKSTIRYPLYEIEWETGQVISAKIYSKEEWERKDRRFVPFRRNARAEGIRL